MKIEPFETQETQEKKIIELEKANEFSAEEQVIRKMDRWENSI